MSRRFIPSGVPKGVNLSATVDRFGVWHDNESRIPEQDRHDCSTHLPDVRERVRRTSFGVAVMGWQREAAEAGHGGDPAAFGDFAAEVVTDEDLAGMGAFA